MPTISSTGVLENLSLDMITEIRYTVEHHAPMVQLVESHKLGKGQDQGLFPKVGQMNVRRLSEGEEMVNEQDLGLTTLTVNTNEVGGYIVITEKALRRTQASAGNLFSVIARQFGDAQSRLMNTDLVGLFPSVNGGTDTGTAGLAFTAANATNLVSIAYTDKLGRDLRIVHHPNTIMRLLQDLSTIGSGTIRPLPEGFSADLLSKSWSGAMIWDVPVFQTGDISRDSSNDAIGCIFDKTCFGVLHEGQMRSDKEYKNRRRAWELVFVEEYIAFEIDDTRGRFVTADAINPTLA